LGVARRGRLEVLLRRQSLDVTLAMAEMRAKDASGFIPFGMHLIAALDVVGGRVRMSSDKGSVGSHKLPSAGGDPDRCGRRRIVSDGRELKIEDRPAVRAPASRMSDCLKIRYATSTANFVLVSN
jgi:hypothetical protein